METIKQFKMETIKQKIMQKLSGNSQYLIKALKIAEDLGLSDIPIKIGDEINNRSYEEQLTIHFKPFEEGFSGGNAEEIQFVGFKRNTEDIYIYVKREEENKPIRLEDFGFKSDAIIGYYLKERNILYIGFNPFSNHSYDWSIFKFYDLVKSLDEKLETVDVKNIQMKILSENFVEGIKRRLEDIQRTKRDKEIRLKDYEASIIRYLRELDEDKEEEKYLEKYSKNKEEGFRNELKKLDNLSFLEKWEIKGTDIVFHFKDVEVIYEDEKVYLGDYAVTLQSDSRLHWKCKNPIHYIDEDDEENKEIFLIHPHISGSDSYGQCWGEKGPTVTKAVANGNYSLLVTYINMFLRTYNHQSPHVKIYAWQKYNKKYNRSLENPKGDNYKK